MNIQSLLKQAQKMQKELEEIEKDLDTREYQASANQKDVEVIVTGKMEIKSIQIKESLIAEQDHEKVEDLVMLAVNGALKAATEDRKSVMKKATGGVKLPGGF